MPYLIGYILILLDITVFKSAIPPFEAWIFGYIVIVTTLFKKDPLIPSFWLFLGVGIIAVNGLTGILYIPSNIDDSKIIIYTILTIIAFHLGLGEVKKVKCSTKLLQIFIPYSKKINLIHTILGIIGIIGAFLICYEMFIIFGVSIDDGGERRAQFQEAFNFMVLTPIGTILLGGCFPSIFSIFCGGNRINKILGLLNIIALAAASMAIAGKQGILFVVLILLYVYLFSHHFKIKIKVPSYIKLSIILSFVLFAIYLVTLTQGRQHADYEGELLENGSFTNEFKNEIEGFMPAGIQNNFAEFLGYYGNQLPYVAERWEIENFENKYGYFRIPRILGPFTFLERQVIKIFPYYQEIYPDDRVSTIKNQTKGYFGNANWGAIPFLNIKYFGIIGGLIMFFFVGKISRFIIEDFRKRPNYITFQLNYINCAGMFYFTMFYITQETGSFIYLIILLVLRHQMIKKEKIKA